MPSVDHNKTVSRAECIWGPNQKTVGSEDDQKKPFTPQERRNEDVKWKEHDMPDEDRDVNKADPEHDYERPDGSERR